MYETTIAYFEAAVAALVAAEKLKKTDTKSTEYESKKTALGTKLDDAFTAVKAYYNDKQKAVEWSSALSAWQTVWKEYVAATKAAGVTIGADAPKDTKGMKWW